MQYYDLHPDLPLWMQGLDARLSSFFDDEYRIIRDAGFTVVQSRGKRLRPLLLLLSCASFSTPSERTMLFAALIELIHTASLTHDDVVDEAASRRGVPSAPARWGQKFSILLGDFLFTRVFDLATNDGDLPLLRLLAAAGVEMSRSVILEYADQLLDAEEERYWQIIHGKTAILFATACAIGCNIGGATPEQQSAAFVLGTQFGTAFQLADDLLDLQGSEFETGKPLGADWQQRRVTLPLIVALRNSSPSAAEDILSLWRSDPFTNEDFLALRCLVEAAGGFEYCWQKVKEYRDAACSQLTYFPAGMGREALRRLCEEAFPLPVLPAVG